MPCTPDVGNTITVIHVYQRSFHHLQFNPNQTSRNTRLKTRRHEEWQYFGRGRAALVRIGLSGYQNKSFKYKNKVGAQLILIYLFIYLFIYLSLLLNIIISDSTFFAHNLVLSLPSYNWGIWLKLFTTLLKPLSCICYNWKV